MNTALSFRADRFGAPGGGEPSPAVADRRARTGLLVLMASLSSLFLLFILAYLIRSQYGDWQSLSAPWQPLANPVLLWFNTALLVASDLALYAGKRSAARSQPQRLRAALALAGLLALAFLLGQALLWQQLSAAGYGVSENPASSFFFLLTGLHGAHVLGGLVAWSLTVRLAWQRPRAERLQRRVQLCALYWHFLLAVWMLLFALLASPPETFEAFASLCGLR